MPCFRLTLLVIFINGCVYGEATLSRSMNRSNSGSKSPDLTALAGNTNKRVSKGPCTEFQYKEEYPCGHGFKELESQKTCVQIFDKKLPWSNARASCKKMRGDLFMAKSANSPKAVSDTYGSRDVIAWTGLNNYQGSTWSWLSFKTEAHVHWQKGHPRDSRAGSASCGALSITTEQFLSMPCKTPSPYICETYTDRPKSYNPRLIIFYHKKPNIVFAGRDLEIRCHGTFGTTGTLTLQSREKSKAKVVYKPGDKGYKSQVVYQAVENRCRKGYNVSLIWMATPKLQDLTFRCFQQSEGVDKPVASLEGSVVIKFEAQKPVVNVSFVYEDIVHLGTPFEANCSAFVGTGGVLSVVLVSNPLGNSPTYDAWTLTPGASKPKGSDLDGINVTSSTHNKNTTFGAYVTATIRTMVTKRLNHTEIFCFSYDISSMKDFSNQKDPLRTDSPPIEVFYLPGKPSLSVTYRPEPPYLIDESVLEASCIAKVGTKGSMQWIYTNAEGESMAWMTVLSRRVYGEVGTFVNVSVTEVDYSEKGPKIYTNFSMRVNYTLQNSFITCDGFYKRTKDNNPEYTKVRSKVFKIHFNPRSPRMTIAYHALGAKAYIDRILTANCSAFVGTGGSLTWVLLTKEAGIWAVDTMGEVTTKGAKRSGVKVVADNGTSDQLGPFISSAFSIKIDASMKNTSLACYSYNVSRQLSFDDFDNALRVTSLPLQVLEEPGIPLKLIASIALICLVAVACVVVGVTFITRPPPPPPPADQEKTPGVVRFADPLDDEGEPEDDYEDDDEEDEEDEFSDETSEDY